MNEEEIATQILLYKLHSCQVYLHQTQHRIKVLETKISQHFVNERTNAINILKRRSKRLQEIIDEYQNALNKLDTDHKLLTSDVSRLTQMKLTDLL